MQSHAHAQARAVIQGLLNGQPPGDAAPDMYGAWAETIQALVDAHAYGGTPAVQQQFDILARAYPTLAQLIAGYAGSDRWNGPHPDIPHAIPARFRLLAATELVHLPPPTFLIRDTLVLGETTVIAGPGDSGKTFLVTDMCWKVAQHYPVCYIAAEDAQGISLRLQAWCRHHNRPYPDQFHLLGTSTGVPCAVELMDTPQIDELITTLRAAGIKLVVIDTLSQCSGGAEENGSDMTRLAAACNRIAHATGAAVTVIHHTTKDGKHYRGHSSLKDNTYGFFDVAKEDDVISLSKVRIKNTDTTPDRHFRLITIDLQRTDSYGDPITSAVALPAHRVKTTGDDLTRSRRDVLSQIALMEDADEAPKTTQIKQSLSDMRERTFYRALAWLRQHGYIKKGLLGTRYQITEAGREKLTQAGDDPDQAGNLLHDAEYFPVNTTLPATEPEPEPPPPGGAQFLPPVPAAAPATPPAMAVVAADLPAAAAAALPTATADGADMPVPGPEHSPPDAVPATAATPPDGVLMPQNGITAGNCHPTAMPDLTDAAPDCPDLPHVSERQWQAGAGQPTGEETAELFDTAPEPPPRSDHDQVRHRLEQAAALLEAGEPDRTVRAVLTGLSGWMRRSVRSGIDRMIQARQSGRMPIDEALQIALAKLAEGGAS